jgi:hypothetical protein
MRGGHKSSGSQEGLDVLAKRLTSLKLMKKDKLISKHSAKHNQFHPIESLDRNLTTPLGVSGASSVSGRPAGRIPE